MKVLGKQTKETEPFWYSVYHSAYSISHTFSPQWLMPLRKEAEMAVARLHGKVKCGPFKEKGRRAPLTKHGITGDHLFVPCFPSARLLFAICTVVAVLRWSDQLLQFSLVLPSWKQAAMFDSIQRTRPVWVSLMNIRSNGETDVFL